ncbi:MAG: hypothetical protein M0R74_01140 [Dehalococcoidia bacterium]|nr:hypothetical protein [Dehalococcoidia bacterium]
MKRLRAAVLGGILSAAALASVAIGDVGAATPVIKGWNNVPYFGGTAPPSEALASINGQYQAVFHWDAGTQQYLVYSPNVPDYVNSLRQINTGDAIWVNVSGQGGSLPGLNLDGTVPTSGKFSVAASTFVPASDLAIYEKGFNELYPVGTDAASQRYFAPVNLPQGASITGMTAHFEATTGQVQVRLDYTPLANGGAPAQIYKLVEVLSTAGPSPQSANAYAHTIDNGANVYFLVVDLTGGPGSKLRGVTISYTN